MYYKPTYNPQIHHRRSIRLKGYDYSQAGLYFITICCKNRKYRFGKIENEKMILNEYGTIAYNEWIKLTERFSNFELDVFQIMPNHMHAIIALNTVGAGFNPVHNKPQNNIVGAGFNPVDNNPQNNTVGAGFNPVHNNPQNNTVGAGFNPVHNNPQNNTVGAGFNPVHNNVEKHHKIYGQSPNGQPHGLPIHLTDNDNWATARITPTIGDIIGAYKSLVANECLKIWKTKWVGANPVPIMGKLWQTNYYEHIIRNQQSYHNISEYIVNNPAKWLEDKFYK
jgi:REP element-mobilizing transposase RayT